MAKPWIGWNRSMTNNTAVESSSERDFNIFDFDLSAEDLEAIQGLDQRTSRFFDHPDPEKVKWLGNMKLEI